jgi:hypothetical protein
LEGPLERHEGCKSDDLDLWSDTRMIRDINQSLERTSCQKDRDVTEADVVELLSREIASDSARQAESHEVVSIEVTVGADLADQLSR